MGGFDVGWIFVGLLGVHVALVPFMATELTRRHKLGRLTKTGEIKPSTFNSALIWVALVAMPVLGEVIWSQLRRTARTESR